MTRLFVPLGTLEAFAEAGRLQSFKKAGENLALSTSAVSQAVKKLEDRLGCQLFIRAGNRVSITPEGMRLLTRVEAGIEQMRIGIEEVRAAALPPLTISSPPGIGGSLILSVMHELIGSDEFDVRLISIEDHNDTSFRNHDVSIVYGNSASRQFDLEGLGPDLFFPVATPAIAAQITSVADLFRYQLLVNETNPVSWDDWLRVNHAAVEKPRQLRFNRHAHIVAAALNGTGVALESLRLLGPQLHNGTLQRCAIGSAQAIARDLTFLYVTSDPARKARAQRVSRVIRSLCMTGEDGELINTPGSGAVA